MQEDTTMPITRYLDPKTDPAFKRLFGTEKNKDILIGFLNHMLSKFVKEEIKEVSFLNSEQIPTSAGKKNNLIDVLCTDEKGTQYIIEMQVAHSDSFEKRAQYYVGKTYSNQLDSGISYATLKQVIFLAILDVPLFPDLPRYKSNHLLLELEDCVRYLKDFAFTFIELSKFTKHIDELVSNEDKWCYFFKHTNEPDNMEKLIKDSPWVIKRAYDEVNAFNWSPAELAEYEASKKAELDLKARDDYHKKEGRAEGRAEGKAEVARNMLAKGFTIKQVAELADLSQEEVEQLGKEIENR
jgi:predicted transposase/invertase (TIGR01784 family)